MRLCCTKTFVLYVSCPCTSCCYFFNIFFCYSFSNSVYIIPKCKDLDRICKVTLLFLSLLSKIFYRAANEVTFATILFFFGWCSRCAQRNIDRLNVCVQMQWLETILYPMRIFYNDDSNLRIFFDKTFSLKFATLFFWNE